MPFSCELKQIELGFKKPYLKTPLYHKVTAHQSYPSFLDFMTLFAHIADIVVKNGYIIYMLRLSRTGVLDLRVLWPSFVMRLRRDNL